MGERHRAESRFHVKSVVEKEAHDALSSGGLRGGGASRTPAASRLGPGTSCPQALLWPAGTVRGVGACVPQAGTLGLRSRSCRAWGLR